MVTWRLLTIWITSILAQFGELPAHGFHCQSQEIGDVDSAHRQVELDRIGFSLSGNAWVAISNTKLATFSPSGLATEGEHPVSRFVQFVERLFEQFVLKLGHLRDHPLHQVPWRRSRS
jgi:hypothetical protein